MSNQDFTFASPTNIPQQGGMVEYGGGTKGMLAMFYVRSVHNPAKSAEQGSPYYEDQIFVKIHPPGERLNIVDRRATHDDQRRWAVQWNQFQQNREQHPDGTPISVLYPDQPSIVATLKAHGVHTTEQLAELSANAIENIGMGCQRYVNEAQFYLEKAAKGAGATAFRRELEKKDREIAVLTRQVAELKAEVDRLVDNRVNATVSLEDVQKMVAGAMGRPTMPVTPRGKAFDAQTAQINATHAAGDQARARKPQRKPEAPAAAPAPARAKRQRAKLAS